MIEESRKTSVLCVADYYLPGFKGGGPIRTIANMIELLAADVEFAVVTRDRDLGSSAPYHSAKIGKWQQVGEGLVYYADPRSFGIRAVLNGCKNRRADIIYLNSFFGFRSSISIYLAWRFQKSAAKLLIAPRGEFSLGALSVKYIKKLFFLRVSRILGLYRDVWWHASTAREAEDIVRLFPFARERIYIATDPVSIPPDKRQLWPRKIPGELRIAFISRISRMKNLDGLLTILAGVNRKVRLAIYGPLEDEAYWKHCKKIIQSLPSTVSVEVGNHLDPSDVSDTFAKYDLFAFPTHGENFGHVIFESLRAGTPVLISDQTPWQIDSSGAVTVVPLGSVDKWRAEIESAADRNEVQQREVRRAAIDYAENYMTSDQTRLENLKMFWEVSGRKR